MKIEVIGIGILIFIGIVLSLYLLGNFINKELFKAFCDLKVASRNTINVLTEANPKIRAMLVMIKSPYITAEIREFMINEIILYIDTVENAKKGIKWDT